MTASARPLVDTTYFTLNDPRSLPASHLGLELIVITCAVLTFIHALRAHRRGERVHLFTWTTILVYSVVLEVISYNFFDNFWHGPFVVMLYHQRLPLYIVAVYQVLLYTGITTARRLRPAAWATPFVAGALIVALDVPYDVIGAYAPWWRWSDSDPNLAQRWLGVPVTSFYWHMAFGAILAALTTPARLHRRLVWALPMGIATMILGFVSFVPFHLLKAVGIPDGAIVAALLAGGTALASLAPRAPLAGPDRLLLSVAGIFYAYHLAVGFALWPHGSTRLAVVLGVSACASVVHLHANRARARNFQTG